MAVLHSDVFSQKEYIINNFEIVFISAQEEKYTGIKGIGEDKIEYHKCDAIIIIDENLNKLTGNISFNCTECQVVDHKNTFNLTITKIATDKYRVTDFGDGANSRHANTGSMIVSIDNIKGVINFNFNFFFLGEQKSIFHIYTPPTYNNINEAILASDLNAVKKFIAKGVDLNASYDCIGRNESPLNFVCDTYGKNIIQNDSIAQLLINSKVNINAQDYLGYTPLMKTLKTLNILIFDMLMAANADKNIKALDGNTALKIAKELAKQAPPERNKSALESLVARLKK